MFRRLFDATSRELIAWASLFVECNEAQDIVQDLYIHLLTQPDRIDENGELLHYLKVAVRNRCFNLIRHRKIEQKFQTLPAEESAEDIEAREQLLKCLMEEVEKLSPVCREVLKLCVFENLSYEEIAGRLQISVNTVKYHIKKAYRELRKTVWPDEIELFLFLFVFRKKF